MWDWYCGELDQALFDYFVGLRANYKTGILSNSGDGARREEQRRYGFEDVTDTVVYSHQVGMMKPEPAIYALTSGLGWHAVVHRSTPESIREVDRILDAFRD